jgi:DNA-binding IclR family transcriptional regulator
MVRTDGKAPAKSQETDRYVIDAVDRALQLMEILAETPNRGITEIARSMGISKTVVFRLLHTLEKRNFVVRDPRTRTSALGHKLLYLSGKVRENDIVVQATKDLIDELAVQSGEDVNLFVRIGLQSVCVATRRSAHEVRMYAEVGRTFPLHAGGSSTVLLAFASEEVQSAVLDHRLEKYTPHTLTEPAGLRRRLAKVRREGLHFSRADVDVAGFSIGAPVFAYDRVIVASISVAGAISRLNATRERLLAGLIAQYARKMSDSLAG